MQRAKQQGPTKAELMAAINAALAEAEARGMLRKTGEYRLSPDGEWQPVYEASPVN